MKTLYLCGPINGCTDVEANDWRTYIKERWAGQTLDPMRRDYRGREEESFREIVELDKEDVLESDIILANCPKPSAGTSMEILFAWENNRPVVAVVPRGIPVSPWIRYHSTHVVHSLADALVLCRGL